VLISPLFFSIGLLPRTKHFSSLLVITSWWLELLATLETILWIKLHQKVHVLPILYKLLVIPSWWLELLATSETILWVQTI
jgi:hypothetical protein